MEKEGGKGGKPRWNRNGAKVSVVGVTKMAERRGRCRLPTDLRDHSLPLSFHPFSLPFFPFYPRLFPLQSLLTTCHPASPSCFWVCRSLECESNHSILLHRPLSRHGRSQNRLIFCSIAFAPMHAPIYRYNYCHGCLSFHRPSKYSTSSWFLTVRVL